MSTLYGSSVEGPNGACGYIVTVEQLLLSPHGRGAFFHKVSRSGKILRVVYHGLQYDRSMRAYYATNWDDVSKNSGPLRKGQGFRRIYVLRFEGFSKSFYFATEKFLFCLNVTKIMRRMS